MHSEEKIQYNKEFFFKKKYEIGLLFLGTLLGLHFDWSLSQIAIFLIFLLSILIPIKSSYLLLASILFLAFTPVLLIIDKENRAEEFAIYAFYFLGMVVIREIIELRQEKKPEEGDFKRKTQ